MSQHTIPYSWSALKWTDILKYFLWLLWTEFCAPLYSAYANPLTPSVSIFKDRAFKVVCVLGCSVMSDSVTPCTVARQAPLSMRFSRQEFWYGLSVPFPGDLLDPDIKPGCPTLQADSLLSEPAGKPNSCGLWDLVSWPGIKPRLPTLGAQSRRHWTTREVGIKVKWGLKGGDHIQYNMSL